MIHRHQNRGACDRDFYTLGLKAVVEDRFSSKSMCTILSKGCSNTDKKIDHEVLSNTIAFIQAKLPLPAYGLSLQTL